MQVRLTKENEDAIVKRLAAKPRLTTATKLTNYLLSLGIIYDIPTSRNNKFLKGLGNTERKPK